MAELGESWRPTSAWASDLRDRDLAGIGLLTQYEVQIYSSLSLALKALEKLDLQQWRNLDSTPLEQVCRRVVAAARDVDEKLTSLASGFESKFKPIVKLRHKLVHAQWGWNPELNQPMGIYRKTHEKLEPADISQSLSRLAELTFEAKAIVYRCAELIAEGKLPSGTSSKAPKMRVADSVVQF